tara:strand:+ start:447 stop:1049 length:603 start_codon:yes stop_codon:yes gene_type:complete
MRKYKNINDTFDYDNIVYFKYDLSKIKDLDLKEYDFFLEYKYEHRWSCFQCKKSDDNISTDKISEYDEDEHVRDGRYDPEYVEEMFDETNEVHDGWSYSIWLSKINSSEFLQNLVKKVDECQSDLGEEDFTFQEFIEWTEYDDYGVHSKEDFYEHLGGNLNDLECLEDELDIDEKGNLIDWYSYGQLDEEYLQLGYRKKN